MSRLPFQDIGDQTEPVYLSEHKKDVDVLEASLADPSQEQQPSLTTDSFQVPKVALHTSEFLFSASETAESLSPYLETTIETQSPEPLPPKQWFKVSFEFGPPLLAAMDQDNQVDIPNHDVQTEDEQQIPLFEKQKLCPDFGPVIKYLETKELPEDQNLAKAVHTMSEFYDINEGILVHFSQSRWKKLPPEARDIVQTCLPTELRLKAMRAYHDDNGHFGAKKTHAQLQMKYYCPGMYSDIFNFVKSCDRCQRAKRNNAAVPPPLHPLPVVSIFGRLHMDIIGPLCKSSEGHQYILVVVDSQSRWVEAWPLKTQTATEIARLLHDEIFCRFGPAIEIISDRGRNFLSKLVQAICELYQVTRHSTSSYRPQANGCVERQNANIIQTIRMYVDRSQRDWHMILPVALMSLRSSPNLETSGFSPFKMLFGCEMRLPFDVNLIPRDNLGADAKVHVEHLLGRLKLFQELAKDNSEAAKEKDKIRHDVKAQESQFLEGDQVLIKINKVPKDLTPKLYDKYDGPYYIRRKCPNDTYIIADSATDRVQPVRHNATKLRRYYDPDDYRFEPIAREPVPTDPPDLPPQPPKDPPNEPPQLPGDPPKPPEEPTQPPDAPPNDPPSEPTHPPMEPPQPPNEPREPNDPPEPQTEPRTAGTDNTQFFPVEKVLKTRLRAGKREFLIKWAGNHPSSWEPESSFLKSKEGILYFPHKTRKAAKAKVSIFPTVSSYVRAGHADC